MKFRFFSGKKKKGFYTLKQFNFNYLTCLLEKSSYLSLGPTSHKNFALLKLIFSDV